jgi:hypothetical protein
MGGLRGRAFFRLVWTITLVLGLWFTWYGVLRQSFAQLGHQTGYGEAGYGTGPYGGGWLIDDQTAIAIGRALGILPTAGPLNPQDQEMNAAKAVRGVALLAVANLLAIVLAWYNLWRERSRRSERRVTATPSEDDPLCAIHAATALHAKLSGWPDPVTASTETEDRAGARGRRGPAAALRPCSPLLCV